MYRKPTVSRFALATAALFTVTTLHSAQAARSFVLLESGSVSGVQNTASFSSLAAVRLIVTANSSTDQICVQWFKNGARAGSGCYSGSIHSSNLTNDPNASYSVQITVRKGGAASYQLFGLPWEYPNR